MDRFSAPALDATCTSLTLRLPEDLHLDFDALAYALRDDTVVFKERQTSCEFTRVNAGINRHRDVMDTQPVRVIACKPGRDPRPDWSDRSPSLARTK